ncbi:MAG: helix-turn-helix domain-containing protein [Okeania sp. SIO3C4]|nr:helix-turn-helix domain-containing protein [Okeania sp. SIO3C4]
MDIKPIKTIVDYRMALKRIEYLMDLEPRKNTPEGDELDILATLVEIYEEKNYPSSPPTPVEAIKFRMEQLGLKNKDLIPIMGSASRVSEILNNKRSPTVEMLKKLYKQLRIAPEILLS